jgi:flagellar hook-associated protein 3 FlgL
MAVTLESQLSEIQDLDYAEAVARMNRQLIALQASQQSYAKLSQLSLFNYL